VRHNKTLAQLRRGQAAVGMWLQTHTFHTARIIAAQGLFDWLLVDLEHTPVDLSMASMIFAAIADVSSGACTPLARVAHGTMDQIKQALDAGAQGIVVPMVNTAEDAARVVRFARYPPLGERGGGGLLPHLSFGTTNHVEYISRANDEILVAVQIETQTAVENVEQVLDVPGIDLIFVGPFDLHISLGLPPGFWSDHPVFLAAVERVTRACKARGVPYGTLCPDADGGRARLAEGFTFIGLGTDLGHMLNGITAQRRQLDE
jgi:4-hydroxy-2-oxoheptanedioate aldolase